MPSAPANSQRVRLGLQLARRALRYLDPGAAQFVPCLEGDDDDDDESGNDDAAAIPVHEWDLLYSTDSTTTPPAASTHVFSHPSPNSHLFAVQSILPGVSARQFWTLMAHAPNRSLWDRTVESASVDTWVGGTDPLEDEVAMAMACRIEVLRFSSIFLVAKARDMVLLSVDARLPSANKDNLRLLSVSSSITSDTHPPRKGYSRFQLNLGGFLVEDLVATSAASPPSIRVTQLSDLGDVAAWVPQSIVRMVASTMVPRGIANIAKVAKGMRVPEALSRGNGRGALGEEEKLGGAGGSWPRGRGIPPLLSDLPRAVAKEVMLEKPPDENVAEKIQPETPQRPPPSTAPTPSPYALVLSPTRKSALRSVTQTFDAATFSRPPRGALRDSVACLDSESEESEESEEEQSKANDEQNSREPSPPASPAMSPTLSPSKRRRLLNTSNSTLSPARLDSDDQLRRLSVALLEPRDYSHFGMADDDPQPFSRPRSKRLSAMVLAGSDAVAMALAPGARESVVFNSEGDQTEHVDDSPSMPPAPRLPSSNAPSFRTSRSSSTTTSRSLPPTTSSSSSSIAASSLMPWALTRAHRKASDASSVSVAESFEVAEGTREEVVTPVDASSKAVESLVAARSRAREGSADPAKASAAQPSLLGVPYAVALWLVSGAAASDPSPHPQPRTT